MIPLRRTTLALGLLTLLTAPACVSRMNGLDGHLTIEYDSMVDPANFTKPIAVGARLDLRASEIGSGRDVALLSAESSNPFVVAVEAVSRDEIVIEGRGTGVAELTIRALTTDGRVLTDRVPMRSAHPHSVDIAHTCSDGAEGVYLVGSRAVVGYTLHGAGGEPLVGWDLRAVRAEDGLELREGGREQSALFLQLGKTPGRASLVSTLPGDSGRWTFRLIEPREIDELAVDFAGDWTLEGHATFARFTLRSGGEPVCQHRLVLEAESLTPELCSVEPDVPGSGDVEITAHAFGICRYRVGLADNRAVAPRELSLRIGKLPGAEPPPPPPDTTAPSVTGTAWQDALARWPLILVLVFVSQLLLAPFWLLLARRRTK